MCLQKVPYVIDVVLDCRLNTLGRVRHDYQTTCDVRYVQLTSVHRAIYKYIQSSKQYSRETCCRFFLTVLSAIFRLHQMHEMQTIVTDECGVCLSVCHAAQLGDVCSVCGALAAAFAKLLWPLVAHSRSFYQCFHCFNK